jgi:hypothetical protein
MPKKKNGNERNMNKTQLIMGEDGKVHQIKCKVCSKIKVKDKLLALKLNKLWKHKHSGRKKALVAILGICKVGEFYMKKYSIHAKMNIYMQMLRKTK